MGKENEFPAPQHRQPGSVPFLWEEKPGTPKKEWKAEPVVANFIPSTAKLVVSVPFKWEEKPGKPLFGFSQSPLLPLPPARPMSLPSPSIDSPTYGKLGCMLQKRSNPSGTGSSADGSDGGRIYDYDGDGDDDYEKDDFVLELDLETSACKQNVGPADTTPTVLGNCLLTTTAVSSAAPVQKSLAEESSISQKSLIDKDHDQHENWALLASDVDSNSTDYNSAGTSILEFLFPLFSPDTGFLDKVSCHKKDPALLLPKATKKESISVSSCSVLAKKTLTLGELIQMSRRIHYRRKAISTGKRSSSMVIPGQQNLSCYSIDCKSATFSSKINYIGIRKDERISLLLWNQQQ